MTSVASTATAFSVDDVVFRATVLSKLEEFVSKTPSFEDSSSTPMLVEWRTAEGRHVRLEVEDAKVVLRRDEVSGSSEVTLGYTPSQAARLVSRWVDGRN